MTIRSTQYCESAHCYFALRKIFRRCLPRLQERRAEALQGVRRRRKACLLDGFRGGWGGGVRGTPKPQLRLADHQDRAEGDGAARQDPTW